MEKLNVLCIDDNVLHLEVFSTRIQEIGHNIVKSASAREGLAVLKREHIHVIVTDYHMPKEDGVTFVKKVRRQGFKGLVLFISDDSSVVNKSVEIKGPVGVIIKRGSYSQDLKSALNSYHAELLLSIFGAYSVNR